MNRQLASPLLLCLAVSITVFLQGIKCPPVTEPPAPKNNTATDTDHEQQEDLNFGLEYERYLKEVVGILETDEVFRKKLEESNISDIKSGEIARHLDFVGHGIRTQLDEIKRKEVDRLRQIIRLQSAVKNGMRDINVDTSLLELDKTRMLAHLDHNNPNTFEIEDLSRLIKQATKDLEDIDQKRKDEFKNYEMEKEHLRRKELEELDATKRAEEEKRLNELKQKHANHPRVHHPGAEAQLQEVWEESDGLNKKDFDPRTFFYLHDTNGDGVLDEPEIEALFQKELDKVYDPNAPEDDMMERYEEMNRMREHVMNEVDTDGDKLISLDEFLQSTKTSEFKKDEGWDTLENQKVYTDEELAEFERQYEELQRQQGRHESDHLEPAANAQGNVEMHQQQGGAEHHQQQQQQQHHEQQQQQHHQQQQQQHHEQQQQQHHEQNNQNHGQPSPPHTQ